MMLPAAAMFAHCLSSRFGFTRKKKKKKNFASNAFQLQNLKYQMPVLPWAPWQVSELSLFTAAWQWDVNVASKETRVWCRKYPWNVVKWLKPKKMNAIMKEIMIPHALHHYTTKKWFLTSLSVFKYNKTPKSLQYCCADTCISYCKCNASLKLGMVKEAILKWCTNFGIFSSHTHTVTGQMSEWAANGITFIAFTTQTLLSPGCSSTNDSQHVWKCKSAER